MSLDPMEHIHLYSSARVARVVVILQRCGADALLRLHHECDRTAVAVQNFARSVREFRKLAKHRSYRPPLPDLPPYRAPIAPLAGGRILCALARGRLKRWRSLKEKRQAWGFA